MTEKDAEKRLYEKLSIMKSEDKVNTVRSYNWRAFKSNGELIKHIAVARVFTKKDFSIEDFRSNYSDYLDGFVVIAKEELDNVFLVTHNIEDIEKIASVCYPPSSDLSIDTIHS